MLIVLFLGFPWQSQQTETDAAAARQSAAAQPELRTELLERMERDQKVRFELLDWMKKTGTATDKPAFPNGEPAILRRMMEVDERNRLWLGDVIKKHGWPGRTLVGEDGAHAAWLLVQHADADRPFQKRCLTLMQKMPAAEVNQKDIAYLVDRVRVGEGRKQVYGTQVTNENGKFQVKPVEEPDKLNERRSSVGLPSIEEYLKLCERMYSRTERSGKPVKEQSGATEADPGKSNSGESSRQEKSDGH